MKTDDEIAAKYGGVRVQNDDAAIAAKYGGTPVADTKPDEKAALAQKIRDIQAAKFPSSQEQGHGGSGIDTQRSAFDVAADQTSSIVQGGKNFVSGIPSMLGTMGRAAFGSPAAAAQVAVGAAKGAYDTAAPIVQSAPRAAQILAQNALGGGDNGPITNGSNSWAVPPDDPRWAASAEGAGANATGILLGEGAARGMSAIPKIGATVNAALPEATYLKMKGNDWGDYRAAQPSILDTVSNVHVLRPGTAIKMGLDLGKRAVGAAAETGYNQLAKLKNATDAAPSGPSFTGSLPSNNAVKLPGNQIQPEGFPRVGSGAASETVQTSPAIAPDQYRPQFSEGEPLQGEVKGNPRQFETNSRPRPSVDLNTSPPVALDPMAALREAISPSTERLRNATWYGQEKLAAEQPQLVNAAIESPQLFDSELVNAYQKEGSAVEAIENQIPKETTVSKAQIIDAWQQIKQKYMDRGAHTLADLVDKEIQKWNALPSDVKWDQFLGMKRELGARTTNTITHDAIRDMYTPLMDATNQISPDLAAQNSRFSTVRGAIDQAKIKLKFDRATRKVSDFIRNRDIVKKKSK